jgi:predicted Zn-dependent protease
MADTDTTQVTEDGTTTQAPTAGGSGSGTAPKMFTQEQVNEIVERRLARAKSTPPADYEDLKAKAAKYDELEQANKSELEKATDAASKANARAEKLQQQLDAMKAESERAKQVRDMAAEYGVDADMLGRMTGDVEDNAKYLKQREDARPKFGDMSDGGTQNPITESLDEALSKAKSQKERIRIRAEYNARNRANH